MKSPIKFCPQCSLILEQIGPYRKYYCLNEECGVGVVFDLKEN